MRILLVLLIATSLAAESTAPQIHPAVFQCYRDSDCAKLWVFFRDKGTHGEAQIENALHELESTYSVRAIARRTLRRTSPGLFDERDLPVFQPYVDSVTAVGAELVVECRWVNAISVRASLDQMRAIAELPCVRRIEPVRKGKPADVVPVLPANAGTIELRGGFYGSSEAQLQQIAVDQIHAAGYTGAGIIIGILDTGFGRSHVAFNEPGHIIQVVAEHDFINNDGNTDYEPGDPITNPPGGPWYQHYHGTCVLGTLAAYKPGELVGGAFDASYVLAKTEDISSETPIEEDYYAAGLQFIEAQGGDIATSSLAYTDWYDYSDMNGLTAVSTLAVNAATDNGLICVTAAGNGGTDQDFPTIAAPGDAFNVITCGAVGATGALTDFSSGGPTFDGRVKPEVLARGEETSTVSPGSTTAYAAFDGTSMSTPLVAGAVACLLQAHPTWTISQIRAALFQTADYFVAHGTFDPLYARGYGIINVNAARLISPCPWSSQCLGDMNCDGAVNQADISPFVSALLDATSYHVAQPLCPQRRADLNWDGLEDGGDIAQFLSCLAGNCP